MRGGIVLTAALTVMATTSARADEWCGYAAKANALIECGYSTTAGCEAATGKGGTCFVDPDYALDVKRATPTAGMKLKIARS